MPISVEAVRAHNAKGRCGQNDIEQLLREIEHLRQQSASSSSPGPAGTTLEGRAVELTEAQIDADLALDGFDPGEHYPEYGHEALRLAYLAGYNEALRVAGVDRLAVIGAGGPS